MVSWYEATNGVVEVRCPFMGYSGTNVHVWENILEIQVEDIYFLIGLSKRGAPVSLLGGRRGGEMVNDYIATYCRPAALPTRDGKINIKDVTQLPMRMILFIIARFEGDSNGKWHPPMVFINPWNLPTIL